MNVFVGMGGKLWASTNELQHVVSHSYRPQPLPALWVSLLSALLLQTHWSLQKGNIYTARRKPFLYNSELKVFLFVFFFTYLNVCSIITKNAPELQVKSVSFISLGKEEQWTASVPLWPAVVERVLLHNSHQQPLLWQDGGKPRLCSNPLGPKPRSTGQVGRGTDRLSMDWRYNDPAEAGGMDSSFGPACCGLFSHKGRPLDQLGGRHESKNNNEEAQANIQVLLEVYIISINIIFIFF